MGAMVLNIILFMLSGFLAMYSVYKRAMNKYLQSLNLNLKSLPVLYIVPLYALAAVLAYFVAGSNDFVEPLTLPRAFLPIVFAGLIYAASIFFGGTVFVLTVATAVGITVWIQPLGIGAPFNLPFWAVRLLVFGFVVIYCLYSRIMNLLPHTFIIPNILILIGMWILTFIGAMPLYVSLCAAALAGILFAYLNLNYYDVIIPLDEGTCAVITYLVSSLLLLNLGEFCFPSCVIFTMLFWAELIVAICNRLFITHSGTLSENTYYFFAAQRHTLQVLNSNIIKIGVILLFIAWFQLFAVNQYSLIIVALCIAVWLNGILGKGGIAANTFKEINRNFISDLKQNINEAKSLLNRTKKDDK